MRITRAMWSFVVVIVFNIALYVGVFGWSLPQSEAVNSGLIASLCLGLAVALGFLVGKVYDRNGDEDKDVLFWITYLSVSTSGIALILSIVFTIIGDMTISFWMSGAVVCMAMFYILWRARK